MYEEGTDEGRRIWTIPKVGPQFRDPPRTTGRTRPSRQTPQGGLGRRDYAPGRGLTRMEQASKNPMPIRNLLRKWIIGEPLNAPEPEQVQRASPQLKGKAGLVLDSLKAIHESIEDSQAMQGYEGTPLQVEQIYWEVWGVLARNPDLTTTEEVMDQWMDDCIGGMHLNWEDPVT